MTSCKYNRYSSGRGGGLTYYTTGVLPYLPTYITAKPFSLVFTLIQSQNLITQFVIRSFNGFSQENSYFSFSEYFENWHQPHNVSKFTDQAVINDLLKNISTKMVCLVFFRSFSNDFSSQSYICQQNSPNCSHTYRVNAETRERDVTFGGKWSEPGQKECCGKTYASPG